MTIRNTMLLACATLCAACALVVIWPGLAIAEGETDDAAETSVENEAEEPAALPGVLKGDTEIEQLTFAYKQAQAEMGVIDARIAKLQARIDELMAVLPAQQARSNESLRQRYIMQSNPLAVIDMLLSSQTMSDFIRQSDYLEHIVLANERELNRTLELKRSIEDAQAEEQQLRASAEEQLQEAQGALKEEQDRRAERQATDTAHAIAQAQTQGGEASVGRAADGGEQPEDYREAATANTSPLEDGADWYADRDDFIAEWAPRIDAYLEGSPLEGQGANFAAAAWKHNVDPRWSPAISNTESSKGQVCIRPYNAWGWGAADEDPYNLALEWGSWEEAIDAHVAGLAKGYSYTISLSDAQRYCPITWQSWYNHTLGEMEKI